jgi:hypothetical protein
MRFSFRTAGFHRAAIFVGSLPLLCAGVALGGEGVSVKITNDGTQDIVVTVYDMNTQPHKAILENARINGFTSVPINVVGDATGRAKLAWTATSVGQISRRCGQDEVALSDDSSLKVHADSICSA